MLGEKGLVWAGHYVDILKGEQFRPEFLAINPKGVVPVLIADGSVITESTVICEYLEEAFPGPPLFPRAPLERARVRAWTKAVDEELHPACSAITYVVSHRHTILRNVAGSFEEFLRRGAGEGAAAACGGDFTMADIAMAPYVNRLAALAMEGLWRDGRLPRVADWFERIQARPTFGPAFVEWLPPALGAEMRANGALASQARPENPSDVFFRTTRKRAAPCTQEAAEEILLSRRALGCVRFEDYEPATS